MTIKLETTGIPVKNRGRYYNFSDLSKYANSRLVKISWIIQNYEEQIIKSYENVIKPDNFTIPQESYLINGINNEYALNNGIEFETVAKELKEDVKRVKFIIGHNYEFVKNILMSELHRIKIGDTINEFIDKKHFCTANGTKTILKIDNAKNGYKMPTMNELYKYCFNEDMNTGNNTLETVKNTAKCFFHIIKMQKQ